MKTKLFLAALTTALTTSFAALAADAPTKDPAAKDAAAPAEQTTKPEPMKKKMKPHSHVEAKGGMVMDQPTDAKEQPKRPPHDHLKEK